ncbi:hypothetical protein [Candidatus Halobonum tyrrellensis]|nr:hypothetical protein [Candidatus Halobonum tyrrellensis]
MNACTRCGTPYGTHRYEEQGRQVYYCVHCKPDRAERVDETWPTVRGSY